MKGNQRDTMMKETKLMSLRHLYTDYWIVISYISTGMLHVIANALHDASLISCMRELNRLMVKFIALGH